MALRAERLSGVDAIIGLLLVALPFKRRAELGTRHASPAAQPSLVPAAFAVGSVLPAGTFGGARSSHREGGLGYSEVLRRRHALAYSPGSRHAAPAAVRAGETALRWKHSFHVKHRSCVHATARDRQGQRRRHGSELMADRGSDLKISTGRRRRESQTARLAWEGGRGDRASAPAAESSTRCDPPTAQCAKRLKPAEGTGSSVMRVRFFISRLRAEQARVASGTGGSAPGNSESAHTERRRGAVRSPAVRREVGRRPWCSVEARQGWRARRSAVGTEPFVPHRSG